MIELCCVYLQPNSQMHQINIQSNKPYRYILTTQRNHLASLTKWFSVVYELSYRFEFRCCHLNFRYRKELLDIQAIIESRFTLKRVRDMKIIYSYNCLHACLFLFLFFKMLLSNVFLLTYVFTLFFVWISYNETISCNIL